VSRLSLSSKAVTKYRTLFLDASYWYKDDLFLKKTWSERYLADRQFSLFPKLEKGIKDGKQLEGAIVKLLSVAVNGYRAFLRDQLQKEHWIDANKVKHELKKIAELSEDLRRMGQ